MTLDTVERLTNSSARIRGIDIARGLAVLGMFAAHIIRPDPLNIAEPSTWGAIVDGRSSILFAVLAGVSVAIISGGRHVSAGVDLLRARIRIFTRAALIFALGGLLTILDTGIAVILEYYAVLFVIALPFLRWSPRRLFILAGVLAVTVPFIQTAIARSLIENNAESFITILLVDGWYPGLIWIVFVLVGLGVGRLAITERTVQLTLLGVGVMLASLGYLAAALVSPVWGATEDELSTGEFQWEAMFTAVPHTGSPFEVIGSTGFAIAVLAACLLLATPLHWPLFPVAAVGQLALTAYSLHIIAIYLLNLGAPAAEASTDNGVETYLWFAGTTLVACTVWVVVLGKGPFESLLTAVSKRAASFPPSNGHGDVSQVADKPQ